MGHDATYWLKWTAGNDVRGKASGVGGGDGMPLGWECVVCCMEHILLPPLPLLHSDLVLSKMSSTVTAHLGPALLCLCQRGWCSTPDVCQDCQWLLPLLCHSDVCKSSLQLFCIQ